MNKYIKKLKIGNVELENNIILAPMAGVTDRAFRKICKEADEQYTPGLICTEMGSSRAIMYSDKKTQRLFCTDGEKRPISYQIFGSDLEAMAYAAKYVSEFADILDINMGCPAPKLVKNGDGSKLLCDLEKAEKIIKAVVENSKVPVTLKMRSGWDKENIVAPELAKIAEKNGISAIIIHGRTRSQFYGENVDLDIIKKVKESVSIPVIGNGDIVDGKSAKHMFDYTNVDGIMIGRGSFGNPWIFQNILQYFETGLKSKEISNKEKLVTILKHIELAVEDKGENVIKEMRKHIAWYTKNLKNSSEFRANLNKLEDKQDVIKYIKEYFETLN